MKHIWLYVSKADLGFELEQLKDEGRDVSRFEAACKRLMAQDLDDDLSLQSQAQELLDRAQTLPMVGGYAHREPSDLAGIRKERPAGPRRLRLKLGREALLDRVQGAWFGRCAGCLLGKPVEGWRTPRMWGYLKDLGRYPLDDFFRGRVRPSVVKKYNIRSGTFGIEHVTCMPEDDDTNYTTIGLAVVKKHGIEFTPEHVANFWMQEVPLLHTCTAERVAYRNFVHLIAPPASAAHRNPYREWIGAQIRADFFGYVALGNPERAAELGWRDASISHIKNGIYGEMWVAAMLAAAVTTDDVKEVIRLGLTEIPRTSRLTAAVRDVIRWHEEGVGFEQAIARIHQRWDENNGHHWCHTISNAQIVALGLLWGEGDYGKAVCRAVQACLDTDCNGATVGSVMGMMLGRKGLPERWLKPMRGTLETGVTGYHRVKIADLAAEGFELYWKNRR
jgi:ADP-ribosylglycohydrolase